MSGRPEVLFPLFAGLETLPSVGPKTAQAFPQMGVASPKDLLFVLPHTGINRALRDSVLDATPPEVVTVEVTVGDHFAPSRKGGAYRVSVTDSKTQFFLIFFHARDRWLQSQLPTGQKRVISGKLEMFDSIIQMVHPDHMVVPQEATDIPQYEPVYPLTGGITQKTMYKAAGAAFERAPVLGEWCDPNLLEQEDWPDWKIALSKAHHPQSDGDLSSLAPHRLRLAYDELFAHQLTLALARSAVRKQAGRPSVQTKVLQNKVLEALPYVPTGAQTRSVVEISEDMASAHRMNRLLQGDVGSGKTLVAFMALLIAVEAGGQGVMMAPTEILARQHHEGLQPLAADSGVVLEVLTGRDKGKARVAKLEALRAGKIDILVGTHAVFQDDVVFQDLRIAIVDEQHRFGVNQRLALGQKAKAADVLVMTATPIPRTLSLAQFGDMDVSILDEKPPGRKPITTALISTDRLDEVVEKLRGAVGQGRQAYWVCPLVEESEFMDMTAANERFKRLRATLGEGVVGLVHGQMLPAEKDAAMADFVAGRTQVLVATTVIEVGVNVPNATIMVIERAENFGLAQLHQLRGRVGRGSDASTCLLLYQGPLGETAKRRLQIMRETEDGFRIAEEDLSIRGAGDMIGAAQSGLPRFRVADLERNAGLMAVAQKDARALLTIDPDLSSARGQAARVLLWLMEQEKAILLISVG